MILNLRHLKPKINEQELEKNVNEILGKSLFYYIKRKIESDKENSKRLFYSIKNIDNNILKEFLSIVDKHFKKKDGTYEFSGFKIRLISIDEIDGYSNLRIPSSQTATYYRDHLNENEILVLLLNKETSDSQSLKNIYEINESSLAENSWKIIKDTIYEEKKISFGNRPDDLDIILEIIDDTLVYNNSLMQITAYIYLVVDSYCTQNRKHFLENIYKFFPILKLFRLKQPYNPQENKGKKDLKSLIKKMEDFYINHLNSEKKEIDKYIKKLENLNLPPKEFEDDILVEDQKLDENFVKEILKDFIQNNSEDALIFEWEDYILPILGKQTTQRKNPCLEELEILKTEDEFIAKILEKLKNNKLILPEEAEEIIDKYDIPPNCKKFLKKFVTLKEIRGSDLELLFLRAVIELKSTIDKEDIENAQNALKFKITLNNKEKEVNDEVLNIFELYYNGIDRKLSNSNIEIDFSSIEELTAVENKKELKLKAELINGNKILKSINISWFPNNLMIITNHYINELQKENKIFNFQVNKNLVPSLEEINNEYLLNGKKIFILDEISNLLDKNINEMISEIEKAYFSLFNKVRKDYGLVVAFEDIDNILKLYNEILIYLDKNIKDYDLIKNICPNILNLFAIYNFPFIIISILHPLKLLWLKNKFKSISQALKEILEDEKDLADEKIFIENMEYIYSSKLNPAITVNVIDINKSTYFSSQIEKNGYELYTHVEEPNPIDLEISLENKAKRILNATLDHYLTLYPFRKDNINISLLELRNIEIVKELSNYEKGFNKKRIFIQTSKQSIKIYELIKQLIENSEIKIEKPTYSIFPNIEYEIHQIDENEYDKYLDSVKENNIDLGICYKFFENKNIKIIPKKENFEEDSIENFFPLIQIIQEPYEKGSSTKRRMLNHFKVPEIIKNFYNLCYIFEETIQHQSRENLSISNEIITFNESFEFDQEKSLIEKLHEVLNWIVFYDKNVDKEIIDKSLEESAVIKYFANIGEKGDYNFLISTRKDETLITKLKESLREYIPTDYVKDELAQKLIEEAKKISGDLVLKATNLGYFFNELIGAVLSKKEIEKELETEGIVSWIYMDDISHWYSTKSKIRPDIAAVNIVVKNNRTTVNMHLIEAKFVSSNNLENTKKEVVKQLKNGYIRFKSLFAPNAPNIDSFYWYYSLYNTIISKLDYASNFNSDFLNKIKKDLLTHGDFELNIYLHANIYCHDVDNEEEEYEENNINYYIRYKNSIFNLLIKSFIKNDKIKTFDKNSNNSNNIENSTELTNPKSDLNKDNTSLEKLEQEKNKKIELKTNKTELDYYIDSVFEDFVGNEAVVDRLRTFIKYAYKQKPRKLPKNILFSGPASTGKTHLARSIAKALKLPFFAISATAIDSIESLLDKMIKTLKEHNLEPKKIGQSGGLPILKFPPMIIFIDEAHELKPKLQEELLTALEPKDKKAYTSKYIADLSDVTFLFATTELGELIKPLKTRLTILKLEPYSIEDVKEIVKKNYPNLSEDVVERIAIAGKLIPRIALEIANDLEIESEAHNIEPSLEALENKILKANEIDELGIGKVERKYLEILNKADREIGVKNIANQLGIGEEEVIEDIEPYLLRLGFIERTRLGRKITAKGKEYLRRIKNKSIN